MDISRLDSGITYTRNVAIAKILWESRYIKKMGSGFITLFTSFKEAGLAPPEGSDVIDILKIPKTTAGRTLRELVSDGLLTKVGKSRNTRYSLSS